ncbi:MAG: ATP-binding protein [Pseudomonadota bacterium]
MPANLTDAPAALALLEQRFNAGLFTFCREQRQFSLSQNAARMLRAPSTVGLSELANRLQGVEREKFIANIGRDGASSLAVTLADGSRVEFSWVGAESGAVSGMVEAASGTDSVEAIMSLLPFPIIIFDESLRPRYANSLADVMLGAPEGAGLRLFREGSDEICTTEDLPMAKVMRTGKPASVSDIERVSSSGARVPTIVWSRPYRLLADGKVDEVLAVVLSSDHSSLTKQIHRIRLEAENAAKAKNRFLANISHELRTPLTAILGFLQLATQGDDMPLHQRRNIELARESGHKLCSLIDNILEIAQIEANEIELEVTRFNIRELIVSIDDLFAPPAELKGVRFATYVSDALTEVQGDREKIRQMLVALVDNAVKFTSHGTVRVSALLHGSRLVIEVSDTGRGIPEERRRRLFEPFQEQLDYQSVYGQAIGLGLPLCKSYATLMQGELSVESSPGKGSVFRVVLPLGNADELDAAQGQASGATTLPDMAPMPDPDDEVFATDDSELATALLDLSPATLDALEGALLRADPVGFRALLAAAGVDEHTERQIEYMVNSYQYDEVLNLLAGRHRMQEEVS